MENTNIKKKRPRRKPLSFCRVCLTYSPSMRDITENFGQDCNILTIKEALKNIMCCEILVTKQTPNQICSVCLSVLKISYDFKNQFESTQKKLFANSKEPNDDYHETPLTKTTEVDLIVGNNIFSLEDVIVVDKDEKSDDYTQLLNNVGKAVTVEYLGKSSNESTAIDRENEKNRNSGDFLSEEQICNLSTEGVEGDEDCETIIIQYISDTEELSSIRDQHQQIFNSDVNISEKINSLIIEGNQCPPHEENQTKCSKDDENEPKRRRRRKGTDAEMMEIEKYIIYGTDSGNLFCEKCSKSFDTARNFNRHLVSVHGIKKDRTPRRHKSQKIPLEIRKSNKKQNWKERFKRNPMLCQICGHISKSSGGSSYHSLTHGEKLYKCHVCSKAFFTSSHLKHHLHYKHEKRKAKHLCPICGEHRNSSTALSYHMKLHTNDSKKFSCPICDLSFTSKGGLNIHLRRHMGDRRYPCSMCNKSFFSTHDRKKHFMAHTGERPHKCKYCERRFVTIFNKKVHMMTHSGPHLCKICFRGLADEDLLKWHIKKKHSVENTSGTNSHSLGSSEPADEGSETFGHSTELDHSEPAEDIVKSEDFELAVRPDENAPDNMILDVLNLLGATEEDNLVFDGED